MMRRRGRRKVGGGGVIGERPRIPSQKTTIDSNLCSCIHFLRLVIISNIPLVLLSMWTTLEPSDSKRWDERQREDRVLNRLKSKKMKSSSLLNTYFKGTAEQVVQTQGTRRAHGNGKRAKRERKKKKKKQMEIKNPKRERGEISSKSHGSNWESLTF